MIEGDMKNFIERNGDVGREKRVEGDIYRYIEFEKRKLKRKIQINGMRVVVD